MKKKTLNSRGEEDEPLTVDVGVKSPNHVNLCYLLCGLIYLLVDRTLPHTLNHNKLVSEHCCGMQSMAKSEFWSGPDC